MCCGTWLTWTPGYSALATAFAIFAVETARRRAVSARDRCRGAEGQRAEGVRGARVRRESGRGEAQRAEDRRTEGQKDRGQRT